MICRENLVPKGHPNRPGMKIKPRYIVIHSAPSFVKNNTALHFSTLAKRRYEKDENGNFLEEDGEKFKCECSHKYIDSNHCFMSVPLDEYCAGVGGPHLRQIDEFFGYTPLYRRLNDEPNRHTLNYTICIDDSWPEAVDNTAQILARDCYKLGMPIKRIIRHFDLTGRICPAPFLHSPESWYGFLLKVKKYYYDILLEREYNININTDAKIKRDSELMNAYDDSIILKIDRRENIYIIAKNRNGECLVLYNGDIWETSGSYVEFLKIKTIEIKKHEEEKKSFLNKMKGMITWIQ